jgi:Ca2+/Na+ antiporter
MEESFIIDFNIILIYLVILIRIDEDQKAKELNSILLMLFFLF